MLSVDVQEAPLVDEGVQEAVEVKGAGESNSAVLVGAQGGRTSEATRGTATHKLGMTTMPKGAANTRDGDKQTDGPPSACGSGASARQSGRTASYSPATSTRRASRPCASAGAPSDATT